MNVFVLLLVVLGEGRIAVCLKQSQECKRLHNNTDSRKSLCWKSFRSCVRADPAAVNGNNG